MSENTQVRLARVPTGKPVPDDFLLSTSPLPVLTEGQVLCQTIYLSLDPYMRGQISGRHMSGALAVGDVMRGETISTVVASKSSSFMPGDVVRCQGGWQEFSVHTPTELSPVAPDLQPLSYALSALGMPGLTAYAGLIWQANPKPGDVVVVPAAIGGVGAMVGQLAKLRGCTVIGISSSEEKCRYAVETLNYDACINRISDDVEARIKALAPSGIDIYFDLVGGELLHIASRNLAVGARVILCGLMAEYNGEPAMPGPPPALWILARATVYGLVVYDFESRRDEFVAACLPDINAGKIVMREDIAEGLAAAPEAFCKLMRGDNVGKSLVSVAAY